MVQILCRTTDSLTGGTTVGKLTLCDLAGSERIGKSEVQGQALKEAQAINKSLSCLGDVIAALGAKQGHVPYRNSKLTHVLQDSLGGNSKTLMFVNCSPAAVNCSESVCSLQFASRAKSVELVSARAFPCAGCYNSHPLPHPTRTLSDRDLFPHLFGLALYFNREKPVKMWRRLRRSSRALWASRESMQAGK